MTARQQAFRREIWLAAKLHDSLSDQIRVRLFLVVVLQELLGHALGINARCHEIVSLVAQYANDFRCQSFVEKLYNDGAIGLVARSYGAFFEVLASTFS